MKRLCLCLCVLTASCVSPSIGADLERVQTLSRTERLARVADAEVEPEVTADVHRLLEKPLDADRAVRIAALNNRELRATLREMGIARGRLIQAGLLPNPVVEGEFLPERNTQLELRVEYDITRAVLAPLRARAAGPDVEAARYRAAGAVVELGYRVRVAFYRLQASQQRLAISQQVLGGYAAAREASRAMHGAGNIAELDLASQEVAYEKSRIMVAQLELDAATERERLQRLLGTFGTDLGWSVTQRLASVPNAAIQVSTAPDLETRVLKASLEMTETQHRLEGLARKAGITRTAGWLPDVTLDVHGLQGNPEPAAGQVDSGKWRLGAGATVGLPLFDRNQGTGAALEAEFDALLERFYGMAIDLRSAAREARARVASSHARAKQYQDVIVPAQMRVMDQTLLQYNAMQVGIYQLLQAKREQLEVQLAQVETLREYWSAVAELDALLAGKRVLPADASTRARPSAGMIETTGGH
jgi:outer membrane protein, heavy metal efflux system